MRNLFYFCFSLFLCIQSLHAQDLILKKNGDELRGKVVEITPTEIKYRKTVTQSGSSSTAEVLTLLKSDVFMIKYENGTKYVLAETNNTNSNTTTNNSPVTNDNYASPGPSSFKPVVGGNYYNKGMQDANVYYRRYKGAGTGTLLVSMLISPIYGLIPAIACGSTMPREHNLGYPDSQMYQNRDYQEGYKTEAKRIKKKKVWKNFWIGTGVYVGIILLAASR
jgi:hypothetical protein